MSAGFARRLLALLWFEIASVLALLIFAGALFAFGSYVSSVEAETTATLAQIVGGLAGTRGETSALDAARIAAARYIRSDLVVVFIDDDFRVSVSRAHHADSAATLRIQHRGDVPNDPRAAGPFVSAIDGLATAFGLHFTKSHVGRVDVIVRENEPVLVATASSFVLPVTLALGLALLAALALSRALVRQAIRPLLDVQRSLERFAAGDLTPSPVEIAGKGEFGDLAVAFNGAIDEVERAFAERDRANAAIRQFIADAGHQLRTPLTVIRGFIAILRKGDLRTPEDRDRILETMNRQGSLMASLIDKLMLLDRWERSGASLAPEPIDVARLVDDVASPLAEANPSRAVRVEASAEVLVAIDPSDLAYAVTNLVDNALKYTRGAVVVVVRADGENALVSVADDGPGLAPAEQALVFDRFYRGSRRDVDGSGLGLAIAKRAVERAGGSIVLATSPHAGSTFTIRLPLVRYEQRVLAPT